MVDIAIQASRMSHWRHYEVKVDFIQSWWHSTVRVLSPKGITWVYGQLDLATSGRGGIGPYVGTCILVAGFGIADAHVQGGMFGEVSFMHASYVQVWLSSHFVANVQSWKVTLFALKWLSIIVCKDFGLPFAAFASICQSLVLSHP
jgi:hypothetical protein